MKAYSYESEAYDESRVDDGRGARSLLHHSRIAHCGLAFFVEDSGPDGSLESFNWAESPSQNGSVESQAGKTIIRESLVDSKHPIQDSL